MIFKSISLTIVMALALMIPVSSSYAGHIAPVHVRIDNSVIAPLPDEPVQEVVLLPDVIDSFTDEVGYLHVDYADGSSRVFMTNGELVIIYWPGDVQYVATTKLLPDGRHVMVLRSGNGWKGGHMTGQHAEHLRSIGKLNPSRSASNSSVRRGEEAQRQVQGKPMARQQPVQQVVRQTAQPQGQAQVSTQAKKHN